MLLRVFTFCREGPSVVQLVLCSCVATREKELLPVSRLMLMALKQTPLPLSILGRSTALLATGPCTSSARPLDRDSRSRRRYSKILQTLRFFLGFLTSICRHGHRRKAVLSALHSKMACSSVSPVGKVTYCVAEEQAWAYAENPRCRDLRKHEQQEITDLPAELLPQKKCHHKLIQFHRGFPPAQRTRGPATSHARLFQKCSKQVSQEGPSSPSLASVLSQKCQNEKDTDGIKGQEQTGTRLLTHM
ncbi:hypothetical protein mRhiFer1_009310 [Rhinolophus ferrumequinum]|uniref:Uncharacterized protein n=1 Tax=Rhinolophus ferrumequinum TaxID=59479 RepID=A0A7J7RXR5_RHIFE|nr:hypothetical protein mRhiFer1_009310 [Rhinolophus ferrumequinum]